MPSDEWTQPDQLTDALFRAEFSRRQVCQGLGLMGAALLLGGCESLPAPDPPPKVGAAASYPPALTSAEFEKFVGTVKDTRTKSIREPEAPTDFLRRFISFSPRTLAETRPYGVIGSVFVEPALRVVEMAVNLQLAREKLEPTVLHDDLGRMAAKQYWRYRQRYFVMVVPNSVRIFGDGIHKNRFLLQMILHSELPSDKIVQVNQDLESLIGRNLTFARLMVNGLPYSKEATPIRSTDIWLDDLEGQAIPEKTISVTLAGDLIRLVMTGTEARSITPADPAAQPQGWQMVSDNYRTFAVGQFFEAERQLSKYAPRNAFEEKVMTGLLADYRPSLNEIKKWVKWGEAKDQIYEFQKHDRMDIFTQQVFLDI